VSIDFLPDFLNLQQLLSPELLAALSAFPHKLSDPFGTVISSKSPEQAAGNDPISLRGKTVGSLAAPDSLRPQLKGLLEATLDSGLRAVETGATLEVNQLLVNDMDRLLDLSEADSLPLAAVLGHFLRLFRAHLWIERAAILGIQDGFTLEGLAGIGWEQGTDWQALLSPLAGSVASTRQPYTTENPATDKHLSGGKGAEQLRNLACLPLLHGSTLVGVLCIANRVGGPFGEVEVMTLRRLANLAVHLLQKEFFKAKMENFERTSDHLGKYLSDKVVKSVKTKEELALGGIEKKVVCLFSDIRGYTTITEGIPPSTLVPLLNFYFEKMHAVIEKYEGTLDKIVGDLIMAVWNIPNDQPEPELLAMKAALEMQKEMIRTVVPVWQGKGIDKVGMGIGVNSGTAVVGNLGSSRFMNYTVIGDSINTAQRLEAKARAGEVWMAEHIFPFVNGKLEKPVRRELDIKLKGKDQTINALVYRPLGY
jgi:class 3 adenylate cyclase